MKTALFLPNAFFPPALERNEIGTARVHVELNDVSMTNLYNTLIQYDKHHDRVFATYLRIDRCEIVRRAAIVSAATRKEYKGVEMSYRVVKQSQMRLLQYATKVKSCN